jgi:hypothetical protein
MSLFKEGRWRQFPALIASSLQILTSHIDTNRVLGSVPRDKKADPPAQIDPTPAPVRPTWGAIGSSETEPQITETNLTGEISEMNASDVSLFYIQESNYPFLSRIEFWIGDEKVKLSLGDLVRLNDGIQIHTDQDDKSPLVFRPNSDGTSFSLDTDTLKLEVSLTGETIFIDGENDGKTFTGEIDFTIEGPLGLNAESVRNSYNQEYDDLPNAWEAQEVAQ